MGSWTRAYTKSADGIIQCLECIKEKKKKKGFWKYNTTSNVIRHLANVHNIVNKSPVSDDGWQQTTIDAAPSFVEQDFKDRLVKWLLFNHLPFSTVSSPHFLSVLETYKYTKNVDIMPREAVKKTIFEYVESTKPKVMNFLITNLLILI